MISYFISIFYINTIVLLTREQKEAIVIKMFKEGYSTRELSKEVHMSFSDIGEIKRRVFGESASYKKKKKLSKVAHALELFSKNKTPIEVTIELDLDPKDVEKIYLNYLGLNGLHQLVKIHQELRNHLSDLISFYWSFREAGADNKQIKEILDVADRLVDFNLEIKNRQNERKNLDIQIKSKNIILQNLDNEIKVASDILSTEYSNLDSVHNEISHCRIQLQNLKKLMKNIENEDKYKNLEKKVEDIVMKIIDDKSINLPVVLVAVLEALRNDSSKTEETYRWVIVEHNKKIYDFVFSSLSHRYKDLLDHVIEVMNSVDFVDNYNITSNYNSSRFHYNNNLTLGFVSPPSSKIDDYGNWIRINFPTYDFQLISKSYGMLIDVDSIYDTGIDYIKRIWYDRLTDTWKETLYETKIWNETKLSERLQMMEGIVRTIEDKNFTNFPTNILNKLERQDFYVPIPLNLQHLNYPNSYDIYFVTFSSYKVDNKTCNLIDTTSFTPIPPPKINITVIPDSLEIRPGEEKNFEIRIDPSTRLPYRINLEPGDKDIINAAFTSNKIPDTHKDTFITNFKISVPETIYFPKTEDSNFPKYDSLPINVTIFIAPSHKDKITNIFIKNKLFSNLTSTIYLPVKINPPLYPIDYLKSAAAEIASPLGTIMTTLGVIVGSIVGISKWFLSQKKVKDKETKDDVWY